GAVHAERGGGVNIGLEGLMIMGTFFGAVGAYAFVTRFPSLAQTGAHLAPLAGVLAAVAAGLQVRLERALVTITYRPRQHTQRVGAVGEYRPAACSGGGNVYRVRLAAALLSGALEGMAGAYLAIEQARLYVEGMTQGRGFIALAAMIFGIWWPVGALGASALF